MFGLCLVYVWCMFGLCVDVRLVYVWFVIGLKLVHVFFSFLNYVWFMSGFCLVNVGFMFGLCLVERCSKLGLYWAHVLLMCWFIVGSCLVYF